MDLDEMASGRANNDIFPGHTTVVKRLTNNAVFRDPVLTAVHNSCGPLESSTESMTVAHKVHAYAALLQQTDLRLQHPDWIQPNRQCPMCDSYEARLIKSLPTSIPTESSDNMVAVSHLPTLVNAKNSSVVIFL